MKLQDCKCQILGEDTYLMNEMMKDPNDVICKGVLHDCRW